MARNRRSTQIRIRSAHRQIHAAAAVDGREIAVAELEVRASRRQTTELLAWAERFRIRRWAIDSANGHGYLLAQ